MVRKSPEKFLFITGHLCGESDHCLSWYWVYLLILTWGLLSTCYVQSNIMWWTAPASTSHIHLWNAWWRHQMETSSALYDWPFVREFTGHRWIPLTKGQRSGALMFSLICAWINTWVNNHEAGDLRCHRAHYDITVIISLLGCHHIAQSKLSHNLFLSIYLNICILNHLSYW